MAAKRKIPFLKYSEALPHSQTYFICSLYHAQ